MRPERENQTQERLAFRRLSCCRDEARNRATTINALISQCVNETGCREDESERRALLSAQIDSEASQQRQGTSDRLCVTPVGQAILQ